jgi:hypothetical protein
MDGEKVSAAEAGSKSTTPPPRIRQRSTIAFPYMDLASAVDLATAIHGHVGLGDCDDDQLAAWSNQSPKSRTFRVQVYAARTFGVLTEEGERHKLTELGRSIVDPNQTREARARAFLTVPLYKAVFDKYRGGVLPPAAALERDMVMLGVAEKQKDRARQVFERSAEQAGFFEHGRNRLVAPGIAPREPPPLGLEPGSGGGGGNEPPKIDPVIRSLIEKLPPPGTVWPEKDRALWLQLLEGSFRLVYKLPRDGEKELEMLK